jgi:UDP-2,3-diacylglucosamine pyrophosphatase LpxH
MPNELDAHRYLLEKLTEIESLESIKGVARVYDSRIGNTNNSRIYFFLPDLHIVSRKYREVHFEYGFNHERVFVDLLKKLIQLREDSAGFPISVCQLGDCVDLWRENLKDPEISLSDFQGVRDGLFELRAWLCLGNHDVEIAQVPRLSPMWHWRLFFPDLDDPRVYVTHGDVLDWLEQLPDSLQKWAVHLFSPKHAKPAQNLNALVKLRKKKSSTMDPTQVINLVSADKISPDGGLDSIPFQREHRYLEPCYKRIDAMNKGERLNIAAAVIAHTHNPGIAVLDDGKRFFVLMDCGSWQGKYQEGGSEPRPCCQVGVVCGNDFRIYQLDANTNISPQFEAETVL